MYDDAFATGVWSALNNRFASTEIGSAYCVFDVKRRRLMKANAASGSVLLKSLICLFFAIHASSTLGSVATVISFSLFFCERLVSYCTPSYIISYVTDFLAYLCTIAVPVVQYKHDVNYMSFVYAVLLTTINFDVAVEWRLRIAMAFAFSFFYAIKLLSLPPVLLVALALVVM